MHDDNDVTAVPRRGVRRATFLKAAAGAALGAGLGWTGSTAMAATPGSSGTPGSAAGSTGSGSTAASPQALTVGKVADLTGPRLTDQFGAHSTDLGIPIRTPDGRMLFIFGDTFSGPKVGEGDWRSPVGLYSTTSDLAGGVKWDNAVGGGTVRQFWDYQHDNPEFSTVLPSDAIVIDGTIYLQVMFHKGLGTVVRMEIWKSADNGETWEFTGARFDDPDAHGGMFQVWTWEQHDDGYVYVFSTKFSRDQGILLHRVPVESVADPAAYEPWGDDGGWGWGNAPTPVLEGGHGEMSLRNIDGTWLLTFFNGADYRIDGIVMDHPTDNLHEAQRQTLILGGEWGAEDDTHIAQLYGGYIIPGSTIDDFHLAVSQWNTDTDNEELDPGWPYRVMQWRIQGFGSG